MNVQSINPNGGKMIHPAAIQLNNARTSCPPLSFCSPWRMVSPARSAYSDATSEERKAAADILNAHLLMVEIMMCNVTQGYVHKVVTELEEKGMMRHNIKRRAKALENLSADLMKRSNTHDSMQIRTFAAPIFPSLVDAYISDGGTLTQKLQTLFSQRYGNDLSLIFIATKNALDKAKIRESGLVANVQMISMLANTGIDFYNYICRKVDALMEGLGSITRVKSRHNEQMLGTVKDLLRELGCGNVIMPEKEAEDVRTLAARFQKGLVSEDLLKMIESGIVSLQMDFTEYVIASLRNGHPLSMSDKRTLLFRLGKAENVRRLLGEIAEISLKENFEGDMFDLMETLPTSVEGTALADFRRLCMKDHILIEPETLHEQQMRKLRQEVYRTGGVLDVSYLAYLYFRLGTKKALAEYLAGAGEVMRRTLSLLKRTRTEELRLKENGSYRMNIGRAVRMMREKRGMSLKTLAERVGTDTGRIQELEKVNDLGNVSSPTLRRLICGLATVLNIAPGYLLFLTLEETDKEGISLQGFAKRLEWLGENELIDKQ